ncbi:MAG: mechanosensitive ion channel family protein [Desulfitobacterium sp.]|nr:mechanosensitive ion channel family protein [Desulfitobacterium sp.]
MSQVAEIQTFLNGLLDHSLWSIVIALGVIVFTLLTRGLIVRLLINLLKKVTGKTKTKFDDKLLTAFEKPIAMTYLILGFYLASSLIDFSPELKLILDRITRSLVLYAIFWIAYGATDYLEVWLHKILEKRNARVDDMLASFLKNGSKIVIIVLGGLTIAQVWFDELAGIITGLGLGGLAFALAAKDTAANLFGSITIMIDRPFEIGDWIQTPTVEGTVEEMGFRSTRVRTFAHALVTIPNSVMSNDPITNWSKMGKRRITYKLRLNYNTTSAQTEECVERIRAMLKSHPEVHPQTIFAYFEGFGENGLEILVYFFTKTTIWEEFLIVQEDINLKIMDILEELDITVAVPARRLLVNETENQDNPVIDYTS